MNIKKSPCWQSTLTQFIFGYLEKQTEHSPLYVAVSALVGCKVFVIALRALCISPSHLFMSYLLKVCQ